MKKRLLLVSLFIAVWGSQIRAQTISAASCNAADVQNAVNRAVSGGTVAIPAGTCTWTSQVTVSNIGITIQGAGSDLTIIKDAVPNSSGQLMVVGGIPQTGLFRFSNMTIAPYTGNSVSGILAITGTCNSSGCSSLRLDHLILPNWPAPAGGQTYIRITNCFGVADHLTVQQGGYQLFDIHLDDDLGVGAYGDNSWATADSLGSQKAFYLEDSTIQGTNLLHAMDCNGHACRIVARHNTFVQANIAPHGTESPGRARGVRHVEVYDNTFSADYNAGRSMAAYARLRAGTGIFFNNTINHINGNFTPSFSNGVLLSEYRANNVFNPWGNCDGIGPWDKNDGATVAATGTFTAVTGSAVTDGVKSWITNQFAPGSVFYTVLDTKNGWMAGIISNTGIALTYIGANGMPTPSIGDSYVILGTTSYGSGKATVVNGATTLTDTSKSWATNQWVQDGAPYSIRNVTQSWGREITANGANTISYNNGEFSQNNTWNNGDIYQILRASVCLDQPGRGQGGLLAGDLPSPVGWTGEAPDPVYEWGDTFDYPPTFVVASDDTARIIANRDYYVGTSSFDGTSGVGSGLLSARPATCTAGPGGNTPGVGYWATDTNALYVCNPTNTWAAYYTPYTYPHPLATGSLPTAPAPPTGLAATVQ